MKKISFILILFALFTTAKAQNNLVDLTWDAFQIDFKIPEGMNVIVNTAEEFRVVNDDDSFAISLSPTAFDQIDTKQLGEVIAKIAYNDVGVDPKSSKIKTFVCGNGEGAFILGVDKDNAYILVAVAVGLEQKRVVLVKAIFYDENVAETAGEVLGSINFN